jgi:2-phosphoglycerate kinase
MGSLDDVRVVLVGGTSNVGKSTVAQVLAGRLGFDYVSTDKLGRHPGRPWATPNHEVPAHVVEHYRSLTGEELVDALLDHYERMWPRIEELVTTRSTASAGLVLEGSGVWPANVARLTTPYTSAVWLSANERVLSARMHRISRYDDLPAQGRSLVDKFLARSLGYQTRMLAAVEQLALNQLDVTESRSPEQLTDEILDSVQRSEPAAGQAHH